MSPPAPFNAALSRAVRRLLLLRDPNQVRRELPRVALSLVPADVGLLIEGARQPVIIGQFGALETHDWKWMRQEILCALAEGAPKLVVGPDRSPREGKGRMLVVPVSRKPERALVVARTVSRGRIKEEALGPLGVYGRVAALALDFASLRQHAVDLRERLEHSAEAVEGGLIVLDASGEVAVMNGAAGWWLDTEPVLALGRPLVDLPGGGKLLAVLQGELRPRMVSLPGGLADIRHRRWERGSMLVIEGDYTGGVALAPGASLSSIFEEPASEEVGPADGVIELALQAVGAATTPVMAPRRGAVPIDTGDVVVPMAEIQRRAVANAVAVFEGDVAAAARALKITQEELQRIQAEEA
ncbi:MAG: hypothetical protein EP330_16090 [Deltaproteobacteria bacterium]|nr:MAG: hypothetical protein EP330_16090 [Deltaproteobacteria bacterium]